jgi:hypothetical protein
MVVANFIFEMLFFFVNCGNVQVQEFSLSIMIATYIVIGMSPPTSPKILRRDERTSPPTSL